LYHTKSSTQDLSNARAWEFYGNGKLFHFAINYSGTAAAHVMFTFGDITSYKSGDAYHTLIIGGTTGVSSNYPAFVTMLGTTYAGHYMARAVAQTGGSIAVGKFTNLVIATGYNMGAGGPTYPHLPDGSLLLAPIWVNESVANGVRGVIPGLWNICHALPLTDGDTFGNLTGLTGKTFEVRGIYSGSQGAYETSDTW
jgi:hypothetical protein